MKQMSGTTHTGHVLKINMRMIKTFVYKLQCFVIIDFSFVSFELIIFFF